MIRFRRAVCAAALLALAGPAAAEPTHVVVRALAKDAKFIGDAMGGVEIILTDARTGKRLGQGLTRGGTGDTKRLIVEPRVRGQPLATPEAARFEATLDITRPTLVKAEARGPLGKPGATITVASEMWLLPGKGVEGDGWVLELPGLVVEPAAGLGARPHDPLTVTAKVTLMCGCPIEPGGHWDANQYDVHATLLGPGDRPLGEATLAYAGAPSTFSGELPPPDKGDYRVVVTARNAATGNTGVGETKGTILVVNTR